MRRGLAVATLLCGGAALAAACGGDAVPASGPGADALPRFTVRGRWEDPRQLRVRVETSGGPVDAAVFERAVARALRAWSDTGLVGFAPAADAGDADVTLGWRRGRHGPCEPFGVTAAVAHSGPVERGTFVHFDAARTWSEDGEDGTSIYRTALHELGHVLGLGHSEASEAIMSTAVVLPSRPGAADLEGLQSLYGGGRDAPGDLQVRGAGGTVAACLRGVAPAGVSGHAVFDTDGDGRAELLVWRTDAAGHGALMAYHFARGPRLLRTSGPFLGVAAPGARLEFGVVGGERLVRTVFAGGEVRCLRFDAAGAPAPRPGPPPEMSGAATPAGVIAGDVAGDVDGDGAVETIARVRG